jgi:hypothetical protein
MHTDKKSGLIDFVVKANPEHCSRPATTMVKSSPKAIWVKRVRQYCRLLNCQGTLPQVSRSHPCLCQYQPYLRSSGSKG